MKSNSFPLITLLVLMVSLASCDKRAGINLSEISLIPIPASVSPTGEIFRFEESLVIYYDERNDSLLNTAEYLSEILKEVTGSAPAVEAADQLPEEGIYLSADAGNKSTGSEGYLLTIGEGLISINAASVAGCFYGIQTLRQIMPATKESEGPVEIPTGSISDFPEFSYRGAMLDVSRHFFEVEDVKRFIDFLAMYKMNALHLHLSDDQGWRIEIKSWPKLTEIGGSTEVGGGEGGYYTQEDYSNLVKYALDRHITIIPEIDMPGHTNAALASYPELNCSGQAPELYTGTEVGFSTLCTNKEVTYQFVEDVVREITALTPGAYFHIGGDESHVTRHDDYIYFINRIQKIVESHGKKVVGWDEIANATLADNAVVQFWANAKNAAMGVEQGAKVIMSPAKKAYLDMKYDSTTQLGLHWAGYIEVDTAYAWNPATYTAEVKKENILGIEAPLWTETITTIDELEYMVFPKLPGYAEIGWSAPELRNWNDYKYRLAKHQKYFDVFEIDFFKSKLVPWDQE